MLVQKFNFYLAASGVYSEWCNESEKSVKLNINGINFKSVTQKTQISM